MDKRKFVMHVVVKLATKQLVSFGIALAVLTAGLLVYKNTMPVVAFMKASDWKIEDGAVSATVTGRKLRQCDRIPQSESGYIRSNGGKWKETSFSYVDDDTPNNSKPRGQYSFGRWQWDDKTYTPAKVMLTVKHHCGDKIITSTIGPFDVAP